MCADADATPVDPFLPSRRSIEASRPSAVSEGQVVVEIQDEVQTAPFSFTAAAAAAAAVPLVACVYPSTTDEVREVDTPRNARAHIANRPVTSRGVAVTVSKSHKRQRPEDTSAFEGSSTSATAAAFSLKHNRPEAGQQESRMSLSSSSSSLAGGTARMAVDEDSIKNLGRADTLSEAAGNWGGNRTIEGSAADDDDDVEEDLEERATAAAASFLMTSQGGLTTANSLGSAAPHPWLVTCAFHVCLWYVCRYAGHAMSAEDLWACRAVLSLTASNAAGETERGVKALSKGVFSGREGGEGVMEPFAAGPALDMITQSANWAWAGSEESELLLRLLLRKPRSFTAQHLETRYGDWLHVQPALDALTQRRFLWWAAKQASVDSAADGTEIVCLNGSEEDSVTALTMCTGPPAEEVACVALTSSPLLEHYNGARVAGLLLSACDGDMWKHCDAATVGESAPRLSRRKMVACVAQAVRATELRTFLTRLRQCSKARSALRAFTQESEANSTICAVTHSAASTLGSPAKVLNGNGGASVGMASKLSSTRRSKRDRGGDDVPCGRLEQVMDNSLYDDTIPRTKRGMILYLIERRYSVSAPSSTVSGSPEASATITDPAGGTRILSHCAPRAAPHTLSSASRITSQTPRSAACHVGTLADDAGRSPYRRCFSSVAEEADAVAQCWDHVIGSVYVPHAGLKQHLARVTETFHVLTSNNGAGMVSGQDTKPVAATMTVATPPTLLMVRPQLLLLLQTFRASCHQALPSLAKPSLSTPSHLILKAFMECFPHALLPRWFTSSLAPTSTAGAVSRGYDHTNGDIPSRGETGNDGESRLYLDVSLVRSDGESAPLEDIASSTRLFQTGDIAEEGMDTQGCAAPPHVCLFASPAILEEYRRALCTQRQLHDVTKGAVTAAQRHRGKSSSFVSHMYDTVMAAVRVGVAAVKRHPRHGHSATSASFISGEASHGSFTSSPASPVVTKAAPSSQGSTPLAAASLESFFYRQGCHADHLLVFTPLYRWFACLELIFPLLQSARRYADANACLHYLLHEPVYVLHHIPGSGAHCPLSPIMYEFRYKPHKRGRWVTRLAQNLFHQKHYAEALAVLEEAQAGYGELASHVTDDMHSVDASPSNSACYMMNDTWLPSHTITNSRAAALCDVLAGNCSPAIESALPPKVQRRGRLLRVLWPNSASVSPATSGEGASLSEAGRSSHSTFALIHAAWEYVRDRYCSRQDRLTLERLLVTAHRKVHPWTPLPAHRELATRCMMKVICRHIDGTRDARDRMLWREPSAQSHRRSGGPAGGAAEGAVSTDSSGARNPQRCPPLPVELFVLHHFLSRWGGASATTTGKAAASAPVHRGLKESPMVDLAKENTERNDVVVRARATSVWCGAHCEGQWIACLARAFLWDCYWVFPSLSPPVDGFPASAPEGELRPSPPPIRPLYDVLWLSAFQDGPLDLATPIQFRWRRRALIESRLAQLERCTREELVAYVAARIRMDRNTEKGEGPSEAKAQSKVVDSTTPPSEEHTAQRLDKDRNADDGGDEKQGHRQPRSNEDGCGVHHRSCSAKSEEGFCVRQEEVLETITCSFSATPLTFAKSVTSSLPPGDGEKRRCAEAEKLELREGAGALPISGPAAMAIPEAWKVPVGSLPLLDILRAIPLEPLWRLLRCLYLSQVTEGVPLAFSGFPDLVFWRVGSSSEVAQSSVREISEVVQSSFCLMEVKGPGDFSSATQTVVSDLLHRCGFEVCVVRVNEVHSDGQRVSTKRIR